MGVPIHNSSEMISRDSQGMAWLLSKSICDAYDNVLAIS